MKIPKGKEGHYILIPKRPFFIYYPPGATHAPHQVPKDWMDKFKGQFDQGWDKYREEACLRSMSA